MTGRMPAGSLSEQARGLFAPLGPTYDRVGAALSLGQDPLGRRFLVSCLPRGGHVLDVATGAGLVAAELRRRGFEVTGLDVSPAMLAVTAVAARLVPDAGPDLRDHSLNRFPTSFQLHRPEGCDLRSPLNR